MTVNRRILWPAILIIGLFCASLIGAALFRRFALGSTVSFGEPDTQDQANPQNKPGSIKVDGRARTYSVHLPPNYDGATPLPVVFVLHGATESPEGVEKLSGMSAEADQENFIAVYPRGTGEHNPARMPTWNSGACCGYAQDHQVDDVAFINALIDKLEHDYAVDTKRIFATGISNGGMMSYRLACELADKIAAVAPVEGAQDLTCKPSTAVSVIVFHGTADLLVPFDGGSTPFQIGSKRTDASVADTVAFWVKEDGCSAKPTHIETKKLHTDLYSGCADGTGVELYAIQGGRHMWPGTPLSGNSVPATDLMWKFFAQHPKP
jgi:polyhydroxybutyrate depolymerase